MILNEIFDRIDELKESDSYLFFITRILKPIYKKNSKVLDKYNFKIYQVDTNDDIRNHLFSLTKDQLNFLISKKYEVSEYDVMSDDSDHIEAPPNYRTNS